MKAILKRLFSEKNIKRLKELIRYGLVGFSTTLINLLTYHGLLFFLDYKIANLIALVVSKTYGYFANKKIVFRSHTKTIRSFLSEVLRFVFARGITALVDYFGLILAVETFGFDKIISKYVIQVIVIILNYILGKFMVFTAVEKSEDKMISFNVPPYVGKEKEYIAQAIEARKISGDGAFTAKCNDWLEKHAGIQKALLTTSCTHATEMAAILAKIGEGDEVIMPSYTFVSTANAFALRGARVKFIDIRPDTMNMNEELIEDAITDRTRAIVPVHYAGVGCEMDTIMDIANRHNLLVIEDAAQAIQSEYKGKSLGTFGNFGCYSFHETKNLSMGEGGALLIRDPKDNDEAEIIREKGTNRSKFFRGEIDKYTWVEAGSSYLPSELNAAYLYAQMECADQIYEDRMRSWNAYYEALKPLEDRLDLPFVPSYCKHNAHMFYIKTKDLEERTALSAFLKENGVGAVFHYVPLHSAPAGRRYSEFVGEDRYTTKESERLLRLPLYYGMEPGTPAHVAKLIARFYQSR